MDTLTSIYSKIKAEDIEKIKTHTVVIDKYADTLNKEMYGFFEKYANGIALKDFILNIEDKYKDFMLIYEKFPIAGEMWESYRLEHKTYGLCASFIYKLSEDGKLHFKRVNLYNTF